MTSCNSQKVDSAARAAVFVAAGHELQLRTVPLPTRLAGGEALVAIDMCTLCGSDLHTLSGLRREATPSILGHEMVGHITAIGQGGLQDLRGQTVAVGDRVLWSVAVSCQQCRLCRRGFPQKCICLKKFGHHPMLGAESASAAAENDWQLSGGLANYCHLPASTSLVVVDDALPDELVCPASCATATVAAAVRNVGTPAIKNSRVLVLGGGMLGLTAAAMTAEADAESITVCDQDLDRLRLARQFGATETLTPTELSAAVASQSARYDCVLEMSGSSELLQVAIDAADTGAVLVLVGAVKPVPSIELNPEQVVRRLLTIRGVHNYAPCDLVAAVEFLERAGSKYPFADLVAGRFPLAQVNLAVEFARKERPIRTAVIPTATFD